MPEEQIGAVYGSGDGSLVLVNYEKENTTGAQKGLNGLSSSIFITRNQAFHLCRQPGFARPHGGRHGLRESSYALSLPGVYRVSVNPGGSAALAFVQNSNYAYYPVKLTTAQTTGLLRRPVQLAQGRRGLRTAERAGLVPVPGAKPRRVDSTGTDYGAPLIFDRPVKAVFSNDGGTAYVLNCGPECGGTASSISLLPVGPMIFLLNQASGLLPCNLPSVAACPNPKSSPYTSVSIPGGASNALIDSSTMYVVGQQLLPDGLFTGNLTVVNLSNNTAGSCDLHQRRRAGRPEPHH